MWSRILCICSIPIIFALWIVEKTKTSLNKDWFKMAGAEGLEASARGFGAARKWYYLVSPNAVKFKKHSNYQQSQNFVTLNNI